MATTDARKNSADIDSSPDNGDVIVTPMVKPPSKFKLLLIIIVGNIFCGAQYSVQAPFYPRMAQEKGLSQTQYGFVFGIYSLGIFLFSPIVAKLVPVVYPKFLIYIGLFISGYAAVLFGILQWSPRGGMFFGLSLLLRLVESCGSAAYVTAIYTLCAVSSLDNLPQFLATAEMCFGIGMIIGPVFGGILYEFGGFYLPFVVLGLCCILSSVFVFIVLPDLQRVKEEEKVSMTKMLFKLPIAVNMSVVFIALLFTGYNEATLEHHVRDVANLSPMLVGFIFLLLGLTYGIVSQIVAYITKKLTNLYWFLIGGILMSCLSFVLSGPLHGIQLESSIGLIVGGQVALGVGAAVMVVCAFTQSFAETIVLGYKNDIATFSVVSGLFSSSFSLGSSIGPVLGGFLVQKVGYRKATIFTTVISFALAYVIMIYAVTKRKAKVIQTVEETEEMKEVKESLMENKEEIMEVKDSLMEETDAMREVKERLMANMKEANGDRI